MVGFVALAAVTAALDRNTGVWLQSTRHALSTLAPPQQNQSMLRTVAPGMLTLMTITFFLLLTLVHRMADVFTWVVVEQFLLHRVNQAFFGYFAGVSAYYVVVVAVVSPAQAVFSTIVALVLGVLALVALVTFNYLVLDQLRPTSVVERVVQLTIATRANQLKWLGRVRQEPLLEELPGATVHAERSGYLVDIDLDLLGRAVASAAGAIEIELCGGLGDHMVVGSPLAKVRTEVPADRELLADAVLNALWCGRERQVNRDPSYGVHQLSSIGWASATQRDPEAALVTADGLHTLLAHWTSANATACAPDRRAARLPIVYRDNIIAEVLSSLANIAVGAAEGGQHQTCAQVLNVFAMALPQLSPDDQSIATAQVRHTVETVARHPFTGELEQAMAGLRRVLSDTDRPELADQLPRAGS
ncbi:MAG: DUF2254 domain-containing protein [Mycobacterium sp.]|nr:DUF2254 domain-containing protein [Mycobacterium sp.]